MEKKNKVYKVAVKDGKTGEVKIHSLYFASTLVKLLVEHPEITIEDIVASEQPAQKGE
jgi:hypothetical protein